jgi:hypothetical protein
MALNDIIFIKQNGGLARAAASEDPVSGLYLNVLTQTTAAGYTPATHGWDTVSGTTNLFVARLTYYEQLKNEFGIDSKNAAGSVLNFIDYHIGEFFRMSPESKLYIALADAAVSKPKIKALQYYADGKIRQVGVLTAAVADITTIQQACTELEAEHQPLSALVATTTVPTLTASHAAAGRQNVSLLAGCDLDPATVNRLGTLAYVGCLGNALGAVSRAAVSESIAWVQKFPVGLIAPGLVDGRLIKDVTIQTLSDINDNRYIFVLIHIGAADNYYNDSHTLDVATSDYAYIENVRTMDKALRGVRASLLPYLNAPLYVDATTGKVSAATVAFLETAASRPLEDMEKAGELSGYRAEIDPDQNVLATSQLEIVINNVPVGVMRKILVKIGFTTKV